MRFPLFSIVAAVAASPFPEAEPAVTSVPALSASVNGTHPTRTGHKNPHKEPTPTFKVGCNCEKPIIPADQLSVKEVRKTGKLAARTQ